MEIYTEIIFMLYLNAINYSKAVFVDIVVDKRVVICREAALTGDSRK